MTIRMLGALLLFLLASFGRAQDDPVGDVPDPADAPSQEDEDEAPLRPPPLRATSPFSAGLSLPTVQLQRGVAVVDGGLELALGITAHVDVVAAARLGQTRRRGSGAIYPNGTWNVAEQRLGARTTIAHRIRAQGGIGLRHLDLGYFARVEGDPFGELDSESIAAAEVSTDTVGIWLGVNKVWQVARHLGLQLDVVDVYIPLALTHKSVWPKSAAFADRGERELERQARAVSFTFPRLTLTY